MFLSAEWAKRWLPSVLLLLSLFFPWWTMIQTNLWYFPGDSLPNYWRQFTLYLSFPWEPNVEISTSIKGLAVGYVVEFYKIPYFCSVSALVVITGLCGFSSKSRTRSLGGLLGIIGVVSYFILVFPKSFRYLSFTRLSEVMRSPFFGTAHHEFETNIWFLSVGFYLALAGSLMLLLPLIRILMERLRKQLIVFMTRENVSKGSNTN